MTDSIRPEELKAYIFRTIEEDRQNIRTGLSLYGSDKQPSNDLRTEMVISTISYIARQLALVDMHRHFFQKDEEMEALKEILDEDKRDLLSRASKLLSI